MTEGPPSAEDVELFGRAQAIAASYGIRLVDWIACDDDKFRSHCAPVAAPGELGIEWWDAPRGSAQDQGSGWRQA